MKRSAPPARPRERHLFLVKDEARTRLHLYGQADRIVKAEPRPDPHPPKAAA